jgi:hypothetical protein
VSNLASYGVRSLSRSRWFHLDSSCFMFVQSCIPSVFRLLASAVNTFDMEDSSSRTYAGSSVRYRPYLSEECDLNDIMDLVDQELSEPYVVVLVGDMT